MRFHIKQNKKNTLKDTKTQFNTRQLKKNQSRNLTSCCMTSSKLIKIYLTREISEASEGQIEVSKGPHSAEVLPIKQVCFNVSNCVIFCC